jgi:tetratricopeptide (TPR) repeat protein
MQAYQESLSIYTNLNDEAGQSQTLNNLGIIHFNQGDTERALAHFKRSLALKERMGDRHGQASTLNNIALLYEKTGAPSLALDHYEQSYEILNTLEDPRAEIVQENITHLRELMSGGS